MTDRVIHRRRAKVTAVERHVTVVDESGATHSMNQSTFFAKGVILAVGLEGNIVYKVGRNYGLWLWE